MKTGSWVLLAFALASAAGCNRAPDKNAAASVANMLAEFKLILAPCDVAFATPRPEEVWPLAQTKIWMKAVYSPFQLSYDVKKSDDLVAPYVAIIDISFQKAVVMRETEAEARSAPNDNPVQGDFADRKNYLLGSFFDKEHYLLNYTYQDGAWKTQSISSTLYSTAMQRTYTAEIANEEFIKIFPLGGACIFPRVK
jgi:hypothetical protein